ncbi:MAG: N-acetylmuramoyl-L-alanine amidase [Acidobacteriota bacterium]
MKRLLALSVAALLFLATIVFAQVSGSSSGPSSGQGILRTPSGDHPITYLEQSGQTYVSAEQVTAGLGGALAPDANGFRVTIGNSVAAFGSDSRYGVIRDDLIEMPVPAILVEGKPFVPWQFFQGMLSKSAGLDALWESATHVLAVRPQVREAVTVQVSIANVQGISKIVLILGAPAEYTIVREPNAYVIRFKTGVRPPFPEQTYEGDPYIAKLTFSGNDLRIQLTGTDIAGDAYQLENPPRIVLDLRKGAPPTPGQPMPAPGLRPQQEVPGIRTIVIDPGHGGKDIGAVGPGGLYEKDVTLAVARKLASSLSAKTGARIVLTREDDTLVSLDERTAIANQYKADLFLSVHMNAAVVKGAKGSETYFLSLEASDELAKKAAETENASAAADPSSDLKLILWDLAQQAYLEESSRFAQAIQEEMNAASSIANRGVKQAPFKVLVGATMPAALVEVGFISNPEEETKLQSDEFQNSMVAAMTRAVERYKTDYETRIGVIQPAPPATATRPAAPAATPPSPQSAPATPATRTEE